MLAVSLILIGQLILLGLLRLRFRNVASYQPKLEYHIMHEPLHSNAVADALLMLAVAKHVKGGDIRRHIELAQVAKEEMASGIECGAMEEAARNEFIKILKNRKA